LTPWKKTIASIRLYLYRFAEVNCIRFHLLLKLAISYHFRIETQTQVYGLSCYVDCSMAQWVFHWSHLLTSCYWVCLDRMPRCSSSLQGCLFFYSFLPSTFGRPHCQRPNRSSWIHIRCAPLVLRWACPKVENSGWGQQSEGGGAWGWGTWLCGWLVSVGAWVGVVWDA
jgi:hypothetical protein